MPELKLAAADLEQAGRLHDHAHDIKNRLNALWEVIRLYQQGGLTGTEHSELLTHAERGFFGALRELESLLDDLGVDRGIRISATEVDLLERLGRALTIESFRLEKKGQTVRVNGGDKPLVLGDAQWIERILQALISNASKFSPRGGAIQVDVDRDGGEVLLRVTDHGVGLSSEDLDQLFVRYAQLGSRSTAGEPQARGTLARARQWAEAHGGSLVAHSAGAGHGCTFELRLPAARS